MSRQYDERVTMLMDMCTEENEIPGYPGYYATEDGDILRKGEDRAFEVRPHKGDKQGHLNVRIKGNPGEPKEPYIHRLVAKTHIPNPNDFPIVRHLDDNRSNNGVDNLAWGNQKDNHDDCVRNGNYKSFSKEAREKALSGQRKPTWAEKDGVRVEYKSLNDAVRATGVQQSNACKVIRGQRDHTQGYRFGYIDD